MALYVLLSREPGSSLSAMSGVARAWEEFDIREVHYVYTPGLRQSRLEELKKWTERLMRKGRVEPQVYKWEVDSTPEALEGGSKDLLLQSLENLFSRTCDRGRPGILLISSGSRRMATTATLAAVKGRRECNLTVLHVHFYFGPWTGLAYPYTPLRLHPLIIENPVVEPRSKDYTSAILIPGLTDTGCRHPLIGELTPLRCAIAELAHRINKGLKPGLVLPSPERHKCGLLHVEAEGFSSAPADLCDPDSIKRLSERIAGFILTLEDEYGYAVRTILAWTGLADLMVEGETGERYPLPDLVGREKLIIDTNLVYYGAHRYFWEGSEIYVPECIAREVHMNVTESIKSTHRSERNSIPHILAGLALKDLIDGGAPIVPTAPSPCDTSIPKIDPIILDGKYLATSDSGALRYWTSHPVSRIVRGTVKVYFEPETALRQKVDPRRDPLSLPRLLYSLHQSLIVLKMMEYYRMISGLKITVEKPGGEPLEVKPPLNLLLKSLGLQA